MKSKTKMLIVMVCLLVAGCLFITGCDLWQQAADPNSGLNVGVDTTSAVVPIIAGAAVAAAVAGFPWAATVLLVTNIVSVVIGTYKNHRKNIVIGEQNEKYTNTKVTTKAIIEAIEAVGAVEINGGGTVSDVVKTKVEEKLKDKDAYLIGKAIITALKGE